MAKAKRGKIIVVGGEKGGTGKTMLACTLVVALRMHGIDAVLVDADPQRSSARWAKKRSKLEAKPEVRVPWSELSGAIFEALEDLRNRCEVVVVDCAGAESEELIDALAIGDLLISPLVPSACDTDTASDIVDAVHRARRLGNRALEACFVFNHVSTNTANQDERDEALADLLEIDPESEMRVLKAYIHTRKPFRRAYRAQSTVIEFAKHNDPTVRGRAEQAAEEFWALYKEITHGDEAKKDH